MAGRGQSMCRALLAAALLAAPLSVGCGGSESAEDAGAQSESREEAPVAADSSAGDSVRPVADGTDVESYEEPQQPEVPASPEGAWGMTLGQLDLSADGDSVFGQYPLGTLSGSMEGLSMRFRYREGELTGTGMIQFDRNMQAFTGYQIMGGDTLQWQGERL